MEDKQQAFNDLLIFKYVCDKHNIIFWLDWGTLLGAVRDKKFIPWEQDIDLGFHKAELDKILEYETILDCLGFKLFKKPEGYALIHEGLTSKIDLGCYEVKNGIAYQNCLDYNRFGEFCDMTLFVLDLIEPDYKYETNLSKNTLFLLIKIAGFLPLRNSFKKIVKLLMEKIGIKKRVLVANRNDYFTHFSKVLFYGVEFKAPNNVKNYLTSLYGKDWRTPKNWIENKNDKWEEFRNVRK